jgi:hypothetical protein
MQEDERRPGAGVAIIDPDCAVDLEEGRFQLWS